MPNRILKETVNESKGLGESSPFAQDLFKRLIIYADDYGRFNADAEIMLARLYPRELDAVSVSDVEDGLVELVGVGKIRFYTSPVRDRMVFGHFPNWTEHQRLRNSRSKYPDPECEEVNDWALRRFVPLVLKLAVCERDDFTCQECGRCLRLPGLGTKQNLRAVGGAVHFDHVVPVTKGGRVTEENIRFLCAACNLRRPKTPLFEELVEQALHRGELRRIAASRGESRPESESESNAQSESESEAETETCAAAPGGAGVSVPKRMLALARRSPREDSPYSPEFEAFWKAYPRKVNKGGAWLVWQRRLKRGETAERMTAAAEHLAAYHEAEGTAEQYIPHAATFLGPEDRYAEFVAGPPPPSGRGAKRPGIFARLDRAFGAGGAA